ncbi:hypothetical protein BCR44DRAFT_33699 [Catenaria anguillulae PL171]|uniref:DNA-directed RNA polymerase III subunit RPC3 n=1 Tax=Catenaria anguillulae PL171 TaxID=765915 RepID=A0A1Y2HH70_9FUNG|nr:hypothetical protein BCR44DRAFT_33699 [Catenaria anguillulae PL171]
MNIDVRLIRDILTPHFGDQVSATAAQLATRGRQSIPQLARGTGLPQPIIRAALVILLQHGLAHYFSPPDSPSCFYTLDSARVLARLRFPRYIKAAKDRYQDEGKAIMSLLLLHGRLSLRQVLALIDPKDFSHTAIRETFIQMAHDRLLIGSTPSSSVNPLDTRLKKELDDLTKLGPMPTAKDLKALAATRERIAQEELDNAIKVGMKRRPGVAASAEYATKAYKAYDVDPEQHFSVNHDTMHMHFRHQMLVHVAVAKINEVAGTILRGVMDLIAQTSSSSSSESSAASATPTTVTAAQVHHKVVVRDLCMDYAGVPGDAQQKVADYLDLLDFHGLLVKDSHRNAYALPSRAAMDMLLGLRLTERYVSKRHGSAGARVFRALHMRGKLEEKQIAKVTMLPAAVARRVCYEMHHGGLIELVPVHKSMDRAPARTVYVYCVEEGAMARGMRTGIKQAICNTLERLGQVEKETESVEAAASAAAKKRRMKQAASASAGGMEVDGEGAGEGAVVDEDLDEAEQLMHRNEAAKVTLKVALLRLERDLVVFESAPAPANSSAPAL